MNLSNDLSNEGVRPPFAPAPESGAKPDPSTLDGSDPAVTFHADHSATVTVDGRSYEYAPDEADRIGRVEADAPPPSSPETTRPIELDRSTRLLFGLADVDGYGETGIAVGATTTGTAPTGVPVAEGGGLYDRISTAGHVALSGAGAFPGLGVIPDAADFLWTAAEIPFGKSSWTDLTLAGAGILATVLPVAGDGAAGAAKIAGRLGDDVAGAAIRSGDEVVGGARNRAAHEMMTDALRADMTGPAVADPKLDGLIGPLYRPNATVGSGSTAAAVRQELATGQPVGGAFHSQKAEDSIRALEKWLDKNPEASLGDRAAAENVIRDMRNALEGR